MKVRHKIMITRFTGQHAHKYIVRIDTHATHGYQVRIANEKSWRITKFFSDSLYIDSLKTAKRYRNKHYQALSYKRRATLYDQGPYNQIWGVGIFKLTRITNETEYTSWVGAYYDNKKRYRKSFSVIKYGVREAKRLAREFRDNGVIDKIPIRVK